MAETQTHQAEPAVDFRVRGSYIPVKEGHPRFNLAVVMIVVAAFIVLALVEAQRLQL